MSFPTTGPRSICARPLLCLSLLAGLSGMPAHANSSSTPNAPLIVGEVTTLIGSAGIQSGDQSASTPLRRGNAVRAGDRIETAPGGHVHIRFIDGGLVSVRPASRLHIQEYQQDQPTQRGAIRFQLEHGVVRSVTGQWGEQARDRYRLNTPVAAIGIKGTDFVVKTQGDHTQAAVITGAIVMAPLDGCASNLGPCNPQQSALLSADMSGKMLELRPNSSAIPRFVPVADLEARLDRPPPLAQSSQAAPNSGDRAALAPQGAGNDKAADKINTPNLSAQLADASLALQAQRVTNEASVSPLPVAATPADRPLVWMRSALEWNIPPNSISQRFDAAEAATRSAVVGNFFITLLRDQTTRPEYAPASGQVAFNLANVSAHYSRPGLAYDPVQVSNARLNVDFNRAQYDTTLDLAGQFGQAQFNQSGRIAQNGTFVANTDGQSIAGALSHDSRQAAYQFEKTLPVGSVSGITLWGRP